MSAIYATMIELILRESREAERYRPAKKGMDSRMKVTSNNKTDVNTVELEIEVSPEELEEAVKRVYTRKAKDISVPGFRKGKAPRKIIEKMYGEGIFLEDAVNDVYPTVYSQAVEETGIEPVAPADVEMLDMDKEKGFSFKAVITVKPEVKVSGYKGIEAEKIVHAVTDEEIDAEINTQREKNSRMVEVEGRAAQDGDSAVIDFEGFSDGIAFEGGKGEDYTLNLGSHTFIEGFEEQIVGHNIGEEFDVNVTFPEQYHSEDLAGKPAVFKVKLKELKAKELPELDDEFAKDVSEFDTQAEYREDTRKHLQEHADEHAQEHLENDLVDAVIEKLEGEIPEVMYESRIDDMVQEFEQRLRSQGMNLELYLQYTGMDSDAFRKTFRDQAERQVKIRLALEKIVELEEIVASEEELDKEYAKLAEAYGMEADKLKPLIPAEQLGKDVANNKAIDLIRESAKITDKVEEGPHVHEEAGAKKPAKKSTKKAAAKKEDKEEAADSGEKSE